MDNDPDFSWRPLDAGEQPAAPEPEPIPTSHAAPAPAPSPEFVAEPVAEAAPVEPEPVEAQPAEPHLTHAQERGAVDMTPPAPPSAPPPPPALAPLPVVGSVPAPAPPADDYEDFDADDVPPPKGRGPASTRYLGLAILVAGAFVFGVLAQKHHDAGFSPPAKGLAALAGAGGGAGAGAGAAAAAAAAAAGGGGGGEGRMPALVGTLVKVSGTDVVVKDANGTDHVVHTTDRTRVSHQETLADLTDGSTVTVSGTPDQSGSITANSLTQQAYSTAPIGHGATGAPTAAPTTASTSAPTSTPSAAPAASGSDAASAGNGAGSAQS